jgi:hypothetical protein
MDILSAIQRLSPLPVTCFESLDLCLLLTAFSSEVSFTFHTYFNTLVYTVTSKRPVPTSHNETQTCDVTIIRSQRRRFNHCAKQARQIMTILICFNLNRIQFLRHQAFVEVLSSICANYKRKLASIKV